MMHVLIFDPLPELPAVSCYAEETPGFEFSDLMV